MNNEFTLQFMELIIISEKISRIGIKNVKIFNSDSRICIYSFLYSIKIQKSNDNELYMFKKSYLGFLFQILFNQYYKEYIKNLNIIEDILNDNGYLVLKINYFPK